MTRLRRSHRPGFARALLTAALFWAATGGGAAQIEPPPELETPPADAEITESGLASRVLAPGRGGEPPASADTVVVHYSGWSLDGELIDSSVQRGRPSRVALSQVIPGWREGLQLMTVGEIRRFWIPAELAFAGQPGKPQGPLVFDIELLDVTRTPTVPEDVGAVPAEAEVTRSGLASRILVEGSGERRPRGKSHVVVHYSGWTTDGRMFDSSVTRGEPAVFPLTQVIRGWTEGLQLMLPGEKRRFWIPQKLAYRGQAGKPAGMLVFDIELIAIDKF